MALSGYGRFCLISAAVVLCGVLNAATGDEKIVSPNARLPHLGVDGTFTLDPTEVAANDPRNPKRVVFVKMQVFSFYSDAAGRAPLAEGCQYAYRGAAGDPFYYPEKSRGSIWELFERTSGPAECARFSFVILRAPHGAPIHMHMRYGGDGTGFEKLLAISNQGPEDKTKVDPWWSVYCAEGKSSCDK